MQTRKREQHDTSPGLVPMEQRLKCIRDWATSCLVPELKHDLDSSAPLASEQFAIYRKELEQSLPILYDLLQQNEQSIFKSKKQGTEKIQATLIEMLCEVTATPSSVFSTRNRVLLRNANRLLRDCTEMKDAVEKLLFVQYQNKLKKNCWKRQLGSIHGFPRFLEFRYNNINGDSRKMSTAWVTFCLSVGLNVRECQELQYKQISTRIFLVMLKCANADDIKELNIHSVIYDAVYKDVHYMDTVPATDDIWRCLCKCLDHFDDIYSETWGSVDDLLETLMRNIPLATNSLISVCLLKYVSKLCCYFAHNRQQIEASCSSVDLSDSVALQICRNICAQNTSDTRYRWAKRILHLFVLESYKLLQAPDVCRQLLQEIHKCYLVCIMPIELDLLEPHLPKFYEKFTAVLMETLVVQKEQSDIIKLVLHIIETFQLQMEQFPYCNQRKKYAAFRSAFRKLLRHIRPIGNNC